MASIREPAEHSDDVTIVAATPDDIDVITSLTRAAYGKWFALIGREPLPMKVDYSTVFHSHRFDLLLDGQRVVGLIETVQQDGHLLIENVAVRPEFHGRGFGRRLMAHAEHIALASGMNCIRLYTNSRFTENIRLYTTLGYVIEREEELNGGTVVHMKKGLS